MRIAVMAAGAVGGYFGARLAAAGHEVNFFARGSNLEAMRRNGLSVESVLGDLHLPEPKVAEDPGACGEVDIVLFAVKLWDTESAAHQIRPLVGPRTRVIPLQNGIESPDVIASVLGKRAVAPGLAYIAAVLSAPGVISHTSQFARMVVGSLDEQADPELEAFVDACVSAGIDAALSPEIQLERWKKFTFLVALSGATASTRMPLGPIMADSDTRTFFRGLMQEVVAVGAGRGVHIPSEFIEERMAFADAAPATMKASMLHDLERGNQLELDWLAGTVVRFGKQLGIPTPNNDAVYSVLKLHGMGTAI